MRKLPAFFVLSTLFACVASTVQGCSSDDGAVDPGLQDGGNSDATVDAAADAPTNTSSSSSSSSGKTPNIKPTDGGIDLENLGPDEYALQINDCPVFTACGGEVSGKDYRYDGGCFDENGMEASVRQTGGCPGIDVSNSRAVVKGTFDFASGTYTRDAQLRVSSDILIPASCSFLVLAGGCDGITANAALIGFPGLICYEAASGSGCDCALSVTQAQVTTGSYSVGSGDAGAATELVLGGQDGGALAAPFCVDGTKMKHQLRADKPSPTDPGTHITWSLTEQP